MLFKNLINAAGTVTIGAAVVILCLLQACSVNDNASGYKAILSESDKFSRLQEWDFATDYALKALDAADRSHSAAAKSEVLSHLAAIDIMTWRDAQAWEHSCEAESLARESGIDSLVAMALLQKGKVCLCGAITEEDVRDDEALGYLEEALKLSYGCPSVKADVLFNISQVYVGKNRFRSEIDPVLYAKAGDYLDAGEALARDHGLEESIAKSYTYRMRYLRQGGKLDEGIDCCNKILEISGNDDFLHKSQAYNQMVMFYSLKGDVENAAAAHQQYVYAMERFMRQKSDALLQNMESMYDSSLKQERIRILLRWLSVLVFAVLLLIALVVVVFGSRQRIYAADKGKEALLRFISKDFTNPSFNSKVSEAFHDISTMDEASIRERCASLVGESDPEAREIADYIVALARERAGAGARFGLTSREMEILRLSREGLTAAQIADRLHISVFTVNNHKQNIYSKMGVRSNAEMIRIATEKGLF